MKNLKLFLIAFALPTLVVRSQGLKEAIHLTDNEQYEAAGTAFKRLVSSDPANGTNYFYFGENYLLTDNPDSALMMYQKGKQVEPSNQLNTIGIAKYKLNKYSVPEMKAMSERTVREAEKAKREFDLLPNKTKEDEARLIGDMNARVSNAQAKYAEAKSNVEEANSLIDDALAKAGSKNALAYMEAADAYVHFKNKNLDKAKLLLDKAAALEPKNPEIQLLYGDIYSELNNGSLAAEYYNKALDLDKNSAKAIVSKGKLYRRSTNFQGAADEYMNAIKMDSTFAPAHRELGEVYFKLGKLEKAKEEYRKYLDLSKNNCSARIRFASFLYLSKDYPGAINEMNQLKQNCDPENLTLLRVATYSYYETKDYAKGISTVQKLFSKLEPEKITAIDYEYYGKLLAANNQDSAGIIQLRKAYEMDNARTDLLSLMADTLIKLKKYPEAISTLNEKISTGKDVKTLDYVNLARSYFFNYDFVKADSAWMKVNELAPTYASGYLNRGRANAYIDSTSEKGLAKPYYEKYIELTLADTTPMNIAKKSGLIESYRYMAAYYVRPESKDYGKVKEYLQKILDLAPDDKEAKEGIDRLEKEKQLKLQKKKP